MKGTNMKKRISFRKNLKLSCKIREAFLECQ